MFEGLQQRVSVEKCTVKDLHSRLKAGLILLDVLEQLDVGHFDISRQIPTQMDHGNNTLVGLQLVPLVTLDAQMILTGGQGTHIPSDIIAPTDGLHPVHTPEIENRERRPLGFADHFPNQAR
jgi:hypothetical protein